MKKILALIMLIGIMSVSAFAVQEVPSQEEEFVPEYVTYCVLDDLNENSNCMAYESDDAEFCAQFVTESGNAGYIGLMEPVEGVDLPTMPGACSTVSRVPEFGTIGAAIALLGSAGAYFKRKKAMKV